MRSPNDWRWQLENAITNLDGLVKRFPCLDPEALAPVLDRYAVMITPYYLDLIDPADPDDPLARQVLPDPLELVESPELSDDPFGEADHSPVPHLVRRYHDRAVLLTTTACAVRCRHCTRRRLSKAAHSLSDDDLFLVVVWLTDHPEVREVLISGGDPLVLSDQRLDTILTALRSVPSLRWLRLATRIPAVLPMRITDDLVALLKRLGPIYMATHFNHPNELTEQALAACRSLINNGIPIVNQAVLLRGVNDSAAVLEDLFSRLAENRIRPYYLFHTDPIQGTAHLRTTISEGKTLMKILKRKLSGLALPTYTQDHPTLPHKNHL